MSYYRQPPYGQGQNFQYQQPNGAYYYQQSSPPPAHPMVIIPQRQVQYQQYQSFDGTVGTPYDQQEQFNPHASYQQPPASRQPQQEYHQPLTQYLRQQPSHWQTQQQQHHQNQYQPPYQTNPPNQQHVQPPYQYQEPSHKQHNSQYSNQTQPSIPAPQPSRPAINPKARPVQQQETKPPAQQARQQIQQKSQQKVKPAAPQPKPQTLQASPKHEESSVNDQFLLLSLAEDYIRNARNLAAKVTQLGDRNQTEEYYQLMANGLGCIDAVLKNFKLQPRAEANLRLRYATLLHEETDNHEEVEKVLSKGIQLADKHRLIDLKYGMQHLMARSLFETRQTAALKFLDKIIPDAIAYRHDVWVYAFRFLRVNMSFRNASHSEMIAALQHLSAIRELSNGRDRAIFATAATLQALMHLKIPASDSIEKAQEAIAAARSEQLDPSWLQVPQMAVLLDFEDLICLLQLHGKPQSIMEASQRMRDKLDNNISSSHSSIEWRPNGSFGIPITLSNDNSLTRDTGGIFQPTADSKSMLMFSSLPREDYYNVALLLSNMTSFRGNVAQKQPIEGARICVQNVQDSEYHERRPSTTLAVASDLYHHRAQLGIVARIYLILGLCNLNKWNHAKEELTALKSILRGLPHTAPPYTQSLLLYVQASINQATGNLAGALSRYRSSALALSSTPTRMTAHQQQLAILAALNAVLVTRNPSHELHAEIGEVLDRLQPICDDHASEVIQAAYMLTQVGALPLSNLRVPSERSVMDTKQLLKRALALSNKYKNAQLVSLALSLLNAIFFVGHTGVQAEKSARAGQSWAIQWNNKLWIIVADAMLEQTYTLVGKQDDARQIAADVIMRIQELPDRLREKFSAAPTPP
ncbi:MAG: hypothetical protein M1820_007710 [Bogoriella megaspora]|nr:MAG: hypothetical protein M1820_007710 [Bogoriella megaspora]